MRIEINLPKVPQTLDYTCGAACFESMFQYLGGRSLGEIHFAKLLGTFELGYTAPEKVAELAKTFGFRVTMKRGAGLGDIDRAINNGQVVFVTWWYEDSGHYSLVRSISDAEIVLMDPWMARENKDNIILISEFFGFWEARGAVMITVSL